MAEGKVAAFPAGVLDQVVRRGIAGDPAHARCGRAKGGGAVELAGGIGQSLLEPVARRLGLLLAGAVIHGGGAQEADAERGGFVLLTGGSSVGKTRSAAEAVKALLPDWWLVHPAGPAKVAAGRWCG